MLELFKKPVGGIARLVCRGMRQAAGAAASLIGRALAPRNLPRTCAALALALAAAAGLYYVSTRYLIHKPVRNVILIIHDAMRADRTGYSGYRRTIGGRNVSLTPLMDRLSREGVSYERAFAPSSWTPISMGSILYDTSPANVYYDTALRVASPGKSLARRLSEAGYYTAAVAGNGVLDQEAISDGFQTFSTISRFQPKWNTRDMKPSGAELNDAIEEVVPSLRKSKSFFLYVHYIDTHDQYTAPDGLVRGMGLTLNGQISTARVRQHYLTGKSATGMSLEEELFHLKAYYDASIRFADATTKDLFELLDDNRLLDDTLVIISSDHGEEFADGEVVGDRNIAHGYNLSNPAIHCPLVMYHRALRKRGGVSISAPVSTATEINRAAEAFASSGVEGYASTIQEPPSHSAVYGCLHWRKQFSGFYYIRDNVKVHAHTNGSEVSDIEGFTIALGEPRETEIPAEILAAALDAVNQSKATEFDLSKVDSRTREQLQALGYLN